MFELLHYRIINQGMSLIHKLTGQEELTVQFFVN